MKKCGFILFLISCLVLSGCAARADDTPHRRTVFAMDTVMNLTAYGESGDKALDAAERELHRLDALLARGTEGSAVYVLNRDGAVSDATVAHLLKESQEISVLTGGAFDPTVAPVLELWGFGSGAGEHRVPTEAELSKALAYVDYQRIGVGEYNEVSLDLPAQLDLGGIAKGWAGERVRAELMESGVKNAVVDLGGDVALLGQKPDGSNWRVAIKDPADGGAYLGVLETAGDRFIMTSGVYERYFEENGVRYHHIIDPATGHPADSDVVSATVICETGVWADAMATACCVVGADAALSMREALSIDLILVTNYGRVLYTCDGFTPQTGNGYSYERVS